MDNRDDPRGVLELELATVRERELALRRVLRRALGILRSMHAVNVGPELEGIEKELDAIECESDGPAIRPRPCPKCAAIAPVCLHYLGGACVGCENCSPLVRRDTMPAGAT